MTFVTTIQQLIDNGRIASVLRKGSADSPNVKILQAGLNELGFRKALGWNKKGASGVYDAKTAAALKQFASRNGLSSNGENVSTALGRAMIKRYEFLDELRHLYDAALISKRLKAMHRGSSDEVSIIVLQTILNELGYGKELNWAKYGADGDYGPSTSRAVKAFADDNDIKSNGDRVTKEMAEKALATFDGYFGPEWHKESVMVETDNLRISESNKRVKVQDGTHSKEFVKFNIKTHQWGMFTNGSQKALKFINANRAALRSLGMTDSAMNVMVAVSENEGNLDAINTWDNSFLTFGMFQWTVGSGNNPGELPALVKRIKIAAPATYEQYFWPTWSGYHTKNWFYHWLFHA